MIAFIRLYRENVRLRKQLESAYHCDSFDCLNRNGGKALGQALIQRDRRQCAAGEVVMLCCDIGGMGALNSAVGELEVNRRVRACLAIARSMRGVGLLAQINSGDEFALVCDRADAMGVAERLRELVIERGFSDLYFAAVRINPDLSWIENANRGMSFVYEEKASLK